MTRIGRNKCHLGLLLIQQLLCIPFPCIVSSANSGWKRLVSQSFYFISYFYTVSWVEIHVHTVVQRKKGTRIKLIIIIHISVDANWATSSTTESGLIQKIAVILKDFSRTFKEKWNSRTPLKFKDFSRLCKPCIVSVQFITNHCSDMLSAKIVWKRSPLDLFIATNDSGLPQSRSTSAVFYVYFLGFSSFIPEKKFKMQRIAFFSMQVSLHGIFSAINTSVNIFANFQIGYGNDTFERSSVFAVETLA